MPSAVHERVDALLWESSGAGVRCLTCERRCDLAPGAKGWCRTRENQGGRLVSLIYGAVSSLAADPIEKKPLCRFHPGTEVLTAGSWSCNFACPWCQNWEISKTGPPPSSRRISPQAFVRTAREWGCQGVALSYNEPALSLEWGADVFPLARRDGLYTVLVTNGYMTPEAFDVFVQSGLQAMNVDIKGDAAAVLRHCGVDAEKIWTICERAVAAGIHIEITTLVIPGVNDSEGTIGYIAARITGQLGKDVPWHLTPYHPDYRFHAPHTGAAALDRAADIAREAGLRYVYAGGARWRARSELVAASGPRR